VKWGPGGEKWGIKRLHVELTPGTINRDHMRSYRIKYP
jgi:hypothetical protein